MDIFTETADVIIVGAGLAGCSAAAECRMAGLEVLVLTKVHPLQSHSGAAQGGINAALYEENTESHRYDTIRGSDYLADQDAAAVLCGEAPQAIRDLEAAGALFSRTEDGRIAQRPFGGQSKVRTCYAKDRTGLICLQTAYEQAHRLGVRFLDEWYVTDILYDRAENRVYGVTAYNMKDSKPMIFSSRAVIFATGGYGRAFLRNSNAHANTGDALSITLRKGLPLEDMEFVQFHPTGLAGSGILISEAARGEGAYLVNALGRRFMADYAATKMELAPRDVVSRAIEREILEGRGVGPGKDAVYLDATHLGSELINRRLPELKDLALCFQDEDMTKVPVSIAPTAHYSMGGLPTDLFGRVQSFPGIAVAGFYAAGECACVSVHGANRLGGNSLLEALIFGRRAGRAAAEDAGELKRRRALPEDCAAARGELERIENATGEENLGAVRRALQHSMSRNAGVFRHGEGLKKQISIIHALRDRYGKIRLHDRSSWFNTELQEILELGHMLDYAEAIVHGALARRESRGAHYRTDYPERDDLTWLKHTLVYCHDGLSQLEYKPVSLGEVEPKARAY